MLSPPSSAPALLDHQRSGVPWVADRPRSLLADEPGLGKSAQLLLGGVEPFLVLAPAMVLESGTWDDELERWAPGADATQVAYSSLCVRGKNGRVERNANGDPIVELKPEYRGRYGTAVLDESHYVKGRKTSWTHGVRKIDAERFELATGTPIPNWAHEAFTQLQLVWPEEARAGRQFGSYWRWAEEWFHVGPLFDRAGNVLAQKAVQDFREDRTWDEFDEANWGDRMLRRLREDCLDLPPLTHQTWDVKMHKEQARVYRRLKEDFVAWLESGEEVVAWNQAAQMVKLLKCATGLEVLDPNAKGSGKLDALRTIVRDRPRPTLVVAHFQDSVEACARAARDTGVDALVVHGGVGSAARKNAIRAFQRGDLQVLCASIELIAEGMTLHQGGADQIVRVERSARPTKNEQVIRRLHRIGVRRPVLLIDLISKGTADVRLMELLADKTDQQMRALRPAEIRSLA